MFFRSKKSDCDVFEELNRFQEVMVSEKELRPFLKNLLKFFARFTKARKMGILLYESDREHFVLKDAVGLANFDCQIHYRDPLITFLQSNPEPLFREDLIHQEKYMEIKNSALNFMTRFSAELLLPLKNGQVFAGLLVIGRREEAYFLDEDQWGFFQNLANLSALHIEQLRQLEKLNIQKEELSKVAELKHQFTANITHELKTPLHGILGMADLILDPVQGSLNSDQMRYMEMLKGSAEGLLEVIDKILDLQELNARQQHESLDPISIYQVVEEIKASFDSMNTAQNLILKNSLLRNMTVYGDEIQIRQLFQNLLDNALKYTDQGSVEISAVNQGDYVRFCVSDTGRGIPESEQEIIFEEFTQSDSTVNKIYEGCGLGLALSKKIVQAHGGRIWLESKIDRGSRFFFTLPMFPSPVKSRAL